MSLSSQKLDIATLEQIDQLCLQFEKAIQGSENPDIADYLDEAPESAREKLLTELILLEQDYLKASPSVPAKADYLERFPNSIRGVEKAFHAIEDVSINVAGNSTIKSHEVGISPLRGLENISDRYVLLEKIGAGAFATVYRANDQSLKREVAVKIPHQLNDRVYELDQFLSEARMLARLDHPSIVPVFDTGTTQDGRIYIVTKLITGISLEQLLLKKTISVDQTLDIIAQTANALDHAHRRGLIHRDLKPSNLLVDAKGQVFVTDFGLALDLYSPTSNSFVGTPAYMSPEQASGESHLVDHRSDIFSLGAIFYQLLTGKRPFEGNGAAQVLDKVRRGLTIPISRLNTSVHHEIERICMKAMAPQIMQRYGSVSDIAKEIEQFNSGSTDSTKNLTSVAARILPKGLSSFNQLDSAGFIQLLPGPRDRNGLPEVISFWKRRIESRDVEIAFRVGLLTGPSGSGKSSLIKAGLIPQLNEGVNCLFLESDPTGTEERLLTKLQNKYPDLIDCMSLVDAMARLRQLEGQIKCLIVLDQFEQGLSQYESRESLVKALRQCDGVNLQCLLIVRDDFGMATTRLMQQLESKIEQGKNFSSVDLFSIEHARLVLSEFANALDKTTPDQQPLNLDDEFIVTAVDRLAEDGQVIAVKLSLFADLVRDREWDRRALDSFGSLTDLGTSFLEQNLGSGATHPIARKHQRPIQEILDSFSKSGFEQIKGGAISINDLASTCGIKPNHYDFSEVIDYLENQLRIISRVDHGDLPNQVESKVAFQLTHDFMVPSVRQWLADQKRSTRKGRTELLFQQLSIWWNNEPVNRRLPSVLEWAQVHWLIPKRGWSDVQKRMMSSANGYYFRYLIFSLTLLFLLTIGIWGWTRNQRAVQLVSQIKTADISSLPELVKELPSLQFWVKPKLEGLAERPEFSSCNKSSVLLASFLTGQSNAEELIDELLCSRSSELKTISRLLMPRRNDLAPVIASRVERESGSKNLNAISLLAQFDPENVLFSRSQDSTVANLLGQNAVDLPFYIDLLFPVQSHMKDELIQYFEDASNPTAQSLSAAVLAEFSVSEPESIAELVRSATQDQLRTLLPFLAENRDALKNIFQADWGKYLRNVPLLDLNFSNEDKQRFHLVTGFERNWVMALRIQDSEFAELDDRIGESSLKLQARIRYSDKLSAAIWRSEVAVQNRSAANLDSRGVEIAIDQVGHRQLPNRFINVFIDKQISSVQNMRSFFGNTSWISDIESSGVAPYGWIKKIERVPFPALSLNELSEFTVEAWVVDWNGVVFSQGSLKLNEDCIWMTLTSEKDQNYSFGWTAERGKRRFEQTLRLEDVARTRHVALVFDGENQRMYLDGKQVFEQPAHRPGVPLQDRQFFVGMFEKGNRTEWGSGQLTHFRVSDECRYRGDFEPQAELPRDEHTRFQIATRVVHSDQQQTRHREMHINGLNAQLLASAAKSMASQGYHPEQQEFVGSTENWSSSWRKAEQPSPRIWENNGTINSAVALWALGARKAIVPALVSSEDQTVRTSLMVKLPKVGVSPNELLDEFRRHKEPSLRQSLVLMLARLSNQSAPISVRNSLKKDIVKLYANENDGSVKSALAQLLDRWGYTVNKEKVDRDQTTSKVVGKNSWMFSPQNQFMVIVNFAPYHGKDHQLSNVANKLAVAVHEVSNEQFLEFQKFEEPGVKQNFRRVKWQRFPRRSVNWFDAARYCNWLSKLEGIPEFQWCFETNGEGFEIPEDYLMRTGYRIPTIAEWQYFASAKSRTPFCFGRDENYLQYFAWSPGNAEHGPKPVGQLLPNAFGLYDVHGNLREWVVDFRNQKPTARKYDMGYVCGGSYGHVGPLMQLDSVHTNPLRAPSVTVGIRIVRTIRQ